MFNIYCSKLDVQHLLFKICCQKFNVQHLLLEIYCKKFNVQNSMFKFQSSEWLLCYSPAAPPNLCQPANNCLYWAKWWWSNAKIKVKTRREQAILLNVFSRLLLAFPGLPYLLVAIITRTTMNLMRMKVMIMMVVVKILCVVDVEGARGGDGQGKVREDHHLSFTQIGL